MARSFVRANSDRLTASATPITALPLTIACWFYSDDATVDQCLVFDGYASGTADYFALLIRGSAGGDPVTARHAEGGTPVTVNADSSSGYSTSTWQHGAAVFSSSTSRSAFLNGGSKGTNTTLTGAFGNTLNSLAVGRLQTSSPQDAMSGRIAEVGVWNVALTDQEIAALATRVSPLRIRPSNLKLYWPLYGNGSPEPNYANNSTSYNLTVTGATATDHAPVSPPFGRSAGWRGLKAAAAASEPYPAGYMQSRQVQMNTLLRM